MAKKSAKPNYEEAVARVEALIRAIEQEEIGVDDLAGAVKEAVGLIKGCQEVLNQTQAEVTQLLSALQEPGKNKPESPAPQSTEEEEDGF